MGFLTEVGKSILKELAKEVTVSGAKVAARETLKHLEAQDLKKRSKLFSEAVDNLDQGGVSN